MLSFFQDILGYIRIVFDLLMNTVESLFLAFGFLSRSIQFTTMVSAYMPPIISGCVTIVVAIGVIKFIIGR